MKDQRPNHIKFGRDLFQGTYIDEQRANPKFDTHEHAGPTANAYRSANAEKEDSLTYVLSPRLSNGPGMATQINRAVCVCVDVHDCSSAQAESCVIDSFLDMKPAVGTSGGHP